MLIINTNYVGYLVDFSHKSLWSLCNDAEFALVCYDILKRLCGQEHPQMNFYCFDNEVNINMVSRNYPTYFAVLYTYQVMRNRKALWLTDSIDIGAPDSHEIFRMYSLKELGVNMVRTDLYTIATTLDYGINISAVAYEITKKEHGVANIFDGPMLVKSSSFYELTTQEFHHSAGFRAKLVLQFIDGEVKGSVIVTYQVYRRQIHTVTLKENGQQHNLTVNTMRRTFEDKILYYKFIEVLSAEDSFVQLTVTKLRTLVGDSMNCEYGGYALSDTNKFRGYSLFESIKQNRRIIIGPYCTKHGTEPLVNNITTFSSTTNVLNVIIYSYTFQMDVDISFEQTICEGIINVCERFCLIHKVGHYDAPRNYFVRQNGIDVICNVFIIIKKVCIHIQNVAIENPIRICNTLVYARDGQMDSIIQTQSKFRYVSGNVIRSVYFIRYILSNKKCE